MHAHGPTCPHMPTHAVRTCLILLPGGALLGCVELRGLALGGLPGGLLELLVFLEEGLELGALGQLAVLEEVECLGCLRLPGLVGWKLTPWSGHVILG